MLTRIQCALLSTAAALLAACNTTPPMPSHGGGATAMAATAAATREFSIEGNYVEACSCMPPCACEQTGPDMSCEGVGAYQFDKGQFDGEDFSGTRVAYSLMLGKSVHFYIDAPDPAKRAAAERFVRAALAGFGPVTGVRNAKVEISGKDGAYSLKVDGGKVMACATEPVLGGDNRTPIAHSNTHDALNSTMYQGLCDTCTYVDGDMKINLDKGSNSYFNQHMKASGKL